MTTEARDSNVKHITEKSSLTSQQGAGVNEPGHTQSLCEGHSLNEPGHTQSLCEGHSLNEPGHIQSLCAGS